MRSLGKFALILALVALPGLAAMPPAWKRYTCVPGRFTINFPGTPQTSAQVDPFISSLTYQSAP